MSSVHLYWYGPVPKAFTGMVGIRLFWVVMIYLGTDRFKSGLLWKYSTVGPQCGTGMARTLFTADQYIPN
jgi:hypothetical protein